MLKLYIEGDQITNKTKDGRNSVLWFSSGLSILMKELKGIKIDLECDSCQARHKINLRASLFNTDVYICPSCRSTGKNNPFFGRVHTEETKNKISNANKGRLAGERNPFYNQKHSAEDCKKISVALKGKMAGELNPFYGRHHSAETIQKLSVNSKQYWSNLSEEERKAHGEATAASSQKLKFENPNYFKSIKRKAGLAAANKQTKYQINKLEAKVADELRARGLEFEYSVIFCHKQFDFGNKETKILLEVHGDYWHGNPKIYDTEKLNKTQQLNIAKDKIKADLALKYNMHLFYIWESEVNAKDFSVLDKIQDLYNEIRANPNP